MSRIKGKNTKPELVDEVEFVYPMIIAQLQTDSLQAWARR